MTADLYDALGLNHDADALDVHRAYRARARTAHPDAGGNSEDFALITLARDVLANDDRRARYDQTGKTDEENQQAAVLSLILGSVRKAMTEAMSMGRKPEQMDLLKAAIRCLSDDIRQAEGNIAQCRDGAAKARAIAKRFSRKGGADLIGPMFTADAAMMEAQISEFERGLETMRAAMAALADHSFQWDEPMPPCRTQSVWFTPSAGAF